MTDTKMESSEASIKQTDSQIKEMVKIAREIVNMVRKKTKVLQVMGEKEPILVEDMSMSYAIAIANFSLYSSFKENDPTVEWITFKEKAQVAFNIAFQHIEDQFVNKNETNKNVN
jgi:hypothetical protein